VYAVSGGTTLLHLDPRTLAPAGPRVTLSDTVGGIVHAT
jgi:hypothetical protein